MIHGQDIVYHYVCIGRDAITVVHELLKISDIKLQIREHGTVEGPRNTLMRYQFARSFLSIPDYDLEDCFKY